jgi:hypothetical protein
MAIQKHVGLIGSTHGVAYRSIESLDESRRHWQLAGSPSGCPESAKTPSSPKSFDFLASVQAAIPREHNQSEVLTLFAHKSAVQGGDPAQPMGLYWLHRDWHLE